MQPRLVDPLGFGAQEAAGDVDPGSAQRLGAPGELRVRILDGEDDPADSGVEQRGGARAGAPGLRARLQGDHGGAAARALPGVAQRDHLGVRTAGEDVPALAGDLALGIEDDAPTAGFGLTVASPRAASVMARRIAAASTLSGTAISSSHARPGASAAAGARHGLGGVIAAVHRRSGDEDVRTGIAHCSMVSR